MSPDPYAQFPAGFFARADESPDDGFYLHDRFVTHIDDGAIAAVGALYRDLGLDGRVLDLMSSWVSHFIDAPAELVVLGMNDRELRGNAMANERVVHDLNVDPRLPFEDDRFDAATCCVSIDYLVRPIEVIADVARVVRSGGQLCITFSNRCFPTKAIRGWLGLTDEQRCWLVGEYVRLAGGFDEPRITLCTPHRDLAHTGDPLYAVVATVL
jgi:SAM-dependent methyltransferase